MWVKSLAHMIGYRKSADDTGLYILEYSREYGNGICKVAIAMVGYRKKSHECKARIQGCEGKLTRV